MHRLPRQSWHDAHCDPTSTRSAAGSARAAPTPGSLISSRSPSSRSRRSRARTTSCRTARPTARWLGAGGGDFDDEIDLRAEDDALIAAELEAAEAAARRGGGRAARRRRPPRPREAAEAGDDEDDEDEDDEDAGKKRRRGRRGGRGRRKGGARELEGTFDHGEEGYGLWLDPAVEDNPVYAEHWAGHRPVSVTIEENQIVIRRAGDDEDEDED